MRYREKLKEDALMMRLRDLSVSVRPLSYTSRGRILLLLCLFFFAVIAPSQIAARSYTALTPDVTVRIYRVDGSVARSANSFEKNLFFRRCSQGFAQANNKLTIQRRRCALHYCVYYT